MRALVFGLSAALLVAACGDGGPSGPGSLQATVESGSIPVGAVVLTVEGMGITGFSPQGTTRVFSNRLSATTHRVVVVGGAPGSLPFLIIVEDVGATMPSVTVIEAVSGNDQGIADVSGITVSVSR